MDTGIVEGSTISMYYDPMISKVIINSLDVLIRMVNSDNSCDNLFCATVLTCTSCMYD